MSVERAIYENDWHECRRCHCRRPERALVRQGNGFICADTDWCDRMVLWNEEQRAVEEAASKPKRKKGR